MSTETKQSNGTVAKTTQDNTANQVLARVNAFRQNGELKLPANYSPENALKSAWLILQEVKDRQGNAALAVCKPHSIANALFDMVVQGLNPIKKQCYFIVYGDQLQMSRSYMGAEMLAKRVGDVKEIKGVPIYEGDEFAFEIAENGRKKITKHVQQLDNIDHEKVKGAYAIIIFNDGSKDTEIMNIKQIRKAWEQGAAKGNSPAHKNFADEMACKSVINRACKKIINSSDDADLYQNDDVPDDVIAINVKREIKDNANLVEIGFNEPAQQAEMIKTTAAKETVAEPVEATENNEEGPGY